MKILVAYASRHGATKGIAERIAETLEQDELEVSLRNVIEVESITEFDAFVIGSSAYMLHWEKEAAGFIRRHAAELSTRPVWLFSSGPVGTDRVDKKGNDVLAASAPSEFGEFPDLIHPREQKVFFGVYNPEREGASFMERLVLKMPAIKEALPSGDFRDWAEIERWAHGIALALGPVPVAAAAPV